MVWLNLVRGGLAYREVRVERGRVRGDIRGKDLLLVDASRLGLVKRDDGRDGGIACCFPAEFVELIVVVAEHVEVERDGDSCEELLEDAVDVVSTHVEKVEVPARR